MKTKIKQNLTLPKVIASVKNNKTLEKFPLEHYSYSTFVRFSINPLMFKIKYINGDRLETKDNVSGIIGRAFHESMEVFYSKPENGIEDGLAAGLDLIDSFDGGCIEYSSTVKNKERAQEIFAFAFTSYIKEKKLYKNDEIVSTEDKFECKVDVSWNGERVKLPVPLLGYIDKVVRRDGKIIIIDYKTTRAFSTPDKIDGAKMIQAVQYFLLVYATTGEMPYSMIYEEVKTSKNKDGSPQLKEYEIVYSENELFFDFYFRLYHDMTSAINGNAVFVPNINDFYDNEVALIAYIHKLDVDEIQAALMKKFRVDNITDLLKKKIDAAGSMRKFLKTIDKKFQNARALNYETMKNEQKIATKLMEHGMILTFDSKIEGHSVDLYRFNPTLGLKMTKLKSFLADIEQVLGKAGVRILAPIPGTSFVGVEVPRDERTFPNLDLEPQGFNLGVGVDVMGNIRRYNITKAPHVLVAGATGAGKSVFLNSWLEQIIQLKNVDLHLFDPKMVELAQFAKHAVQHETEVLDIHLALQLLVDEMNSRYEKMAAAGVRDISELPEGTMNYKFIFVDEFGDLTVGDKTIEETVNTGEIYQVGAKKGMPKTKIEKTNLSKEIMKSILLLAQKSRAAGMHMVIATQRPSVDIITGSIKANFPVKVAFRTSKETDSRVLLDGPGAEKLQGKGDMLFSSEDGIERLQGFNC